jgi:hypothetical protein
LGPASTFGRTRRSGLGRGGARYHTGGSNGPIRCPGVRKIGGFPSGNTATTRPIRMPPFRGQLTNRVPASLGRFTAAANALPDHFCGAVGCSPRRVIPPGSVRRVAGRLCRGFALLPGEGGIGCTTRHPPFGVCGGTQASHFRKPASTMHRQGWIRQLDEPGPRIEIGDPLSSNDLRERVSRRSGPLARAS